jgi:hypothetical protein
VETRADNGVRTTADVKDVFETVNGGDLALAALVGSAHDHDLVLALFSIRSGATQGSRMRTSFRTGMLLKLAVRLSVEQAKLYLFTLCFSRSSLLSGAYLRQYILPTRLPAAGPTNRHDDAADAAGSAEVRLPRLAARARDICLNLGHCAGG